MGKHGMLLWQAAPLGTYNWTIFQTEKKSEKSPKKINKNCSKRPHSNWFTNIFHSLGGWILGKNIRNTVTERQAGESQEKNTQISFFAMRSLNSKHVSTHLRLSVAIRRSLFPSAAAIVKECQFTSAFHREF